ncbi:MAG: ABC transporter ATP-binding protein [Hyphomicrobium sp.]
MLRVDTLKLDPLPPLTFSVADGECLAIDGASGAGKTRVLRAIADLDAAPGLIAIDGTDRRDIPGPEWRKRARYLTSEPQWWTDTARPAFDLTQRGANDRLARLLSQLALHPRILDQPLHRLSLGERRRLALVLALHDEPRVLLLDEPALGLDLPLAALVADVLRLQLLAGRSLVMVTHDPGPVARLAHARLQLTRPMGPRGLVAS